MRQRCAPPELDWSRRHPVARRASMPARHSTAWATRAKLTTVKR